MSLSFGESTTGSNEMIEVEFGLKLLLCKTMFKLAFSVDHAIDKIAIVAV